MNNTKEHFKYFDTTADIGIEVQTPDITEAFKNCAKATLNLITDIEKIKKNITKEISLTSEDEYGLLYDWITELLILLDSENFMASQYNIEIRKKKTNYVLNGEIIGDVYDTGKYNYKTEVKAITYHEMDINMTPEKVNIKFIVDL